VPKPIWTPSPERLESHQLSKYAGYVASRYGVDFRFDYSALHRWSVTQPAQFWTSVIEFTGVVCEGELSPAIVDADRLPGARWFPNLRLNFAENLLRHPASQPAIIACDEGGARRTRSFGELRADTERHMASLHGAGIGPESTVAAILPNIYDAVPAMLAATGLGATWCSVSPDFGVGGILDRLGQVAPQVIYAVQSYRHNGKTYDVSEKIALMVSQLPTVERVVIVGAVESDATSADAARSLPEKTLSLEEFLATASGPAPGFRRLPFDHPLFVLFTSGTTGVPKCIEHGAGGTLVQLLKEHVLHCNVGPGSRMLFPTTLGWMMWNWLVTGLASGCTIVLYDGSPAHPSQTALFDMIQRERVTMLGLPGALIEGLRKSGLDLRQSHRFESIDMIFAGGSVLSAEAFEFMNEHVMPGKPLYSCSGGTDIVSCFLIADPWSPIYAGELSAAGLGMDVQVFDENGTSVTDRKGELVCLQPAPSMPRGFRNDPDARRYRAAYFDRFPGIWAHGDYAERTNRGTFIIYGRSDAVLNPGGVRIGTAEIYRYVDCIPGVLASVAVGQKFGDDIRVVLFVKLAQGLALNQTLEERIRREIREGASPRHVPKVIRQVPDVPLTRSGKIAEIAVRDVVNGHTVKATEALANPEVLLHFELPP
jgi:acetoacetyl-CoA synthetase